MMPPLEKSAKVRKAYRRLRGKRCGNRARMCVSFDLFYPADHSNPAEDRVLLLESLLSLEKHFVEFHKIPGFRLVKYTANGRPIV